MVWMQGAKERGGRRTFRYVALTSNEGNAADKPIMDTLRMGRRGGERSESQETGQGYRID